MRDAALLFRDQSGFDCRKAILVYGYDYPGRPLDPVLAALEKLAGLSIGERHESELGELVHPVHRTGRVAAWEVM